MLTSSRRAAEMLCCVRARCPRSAPGDDQVKICGAEIFSINALALQFCPREARFRLIDPAYDGVEDLSEPAAFACYTPKSFVDDPTRILRALRFAVRLGLRDRERKRLNCF